MQLLEDYGLGMQLHGAKATALTLLTSHGVCFVHSELTYQDKTTDYHCFVYDGRPRDDGQRGELIDTLFNFCRRRRKFHHFLLDEEDNRLLLEHKDELTKEKAANEFVLAFFNDDDPAKSAKSATSATSAVETVELLGIYRVFDAVEAARRKAEKEAKREASRQDHMARAAQNELKRRENAARAERAAQKRAIAGEPEASPAAKKAKNS